MKGQEEMHIHAPMVISNAGIFNTYQKLLPKELQAMPGRAATKLVVFIMTQSTLWSRKCIFFFDQLLLIMQ